MSLLLFWKKRRAPAKYVMAVRVIGSAATMRVMRYMMAGVDIVKVAGSAATMWKSVVLTPTIPRGGFVLPWWLRPIRVTRRTIWRVGTGRVRVTGAPARLTYRSRQVIINEDDELLTLLIMLDCL
jgi:hypothetical protein